MNLSAIKALCAGGKHATIYNAMWGGGQWISNGFGAWPVEGIRIEDEEALMELWNLSDKARAKAIIMWEATSDRRFTQAPFEGEEKLKELGGATFGDDSLFIALQSSRGVLWIDANLLKPLQSDYRQYYARWEQDRPLVAVYEDLAVCKALILPTTDNTVADLLQAAAEKMRTNHFHWRDAEDDAVEAMFRQDDPIDD